MILHTDTVQRYSGMIIQYVPGTVSYTYDMNMTNTVIR